MCCFRLFIIIIFIFFYVCLFFEYLNSQKLKTVISYLQTLIGSYVGKLRFSVNILYFMESNIFFKCFNCTNTYISNSLLVSCCRDYKPSFSLLRILSYIMSLMATFFFYFQFWLVYRLRPCTLHSMTTFIY